MRNSRLWAAMLALSVAGIAVGTLCAAAYRAGRRIDPTLRYLDPRRAPTSDEAFLTYAVEYALHSDEPNDLVFIGDSTCTAGIDPIAISRLTGLRSYNLGSVGDLGPRVYRVILASYFKGHPKPRLVVLCLSPFAFETDVHSASADVSDQFVANYGTEVGEFPLIQTAEYFIKRGALNNNLYRSHTDVRDLLVEGATGETYWTLRDRINRRRGFFLSPGEHGGNCGLTAAPEHFIRSDWDAGVRDIIETSESAGVPLLILFGPISRTVSKSRDFAQLELWVDRVQARVARPLLTIYDPESMWDAKHLNARGIEAFMPIVAKDVQAALSN